MTMTINFMKIIENYKVKIINFSNNNKSEINNIVNKIYVINLQENEARRNYVLVLMKKLNIDFTLIVVEKITNENYTIINKIYNISKSESGCLISHLWCLNDIIQNNHKNAIIFEDDIILHKNFKNMLIERLKTNYDLLLLGACDFNFSQYNYKNIQNNIYNPVTFDKLYGAHANYYSLEGAKKMFELKTQNISFFDNNYNEIFNYFKEKSAICYPNLVVSDISTSNLGHSYKFLSLTEKYYYEKCFKNFNFCNYNFIYLNLLKNSEINCKFFKNYEEYINNVLYYFFYDTEKVKLIKNRLELSFFTIDDIKTILYKDNQ
jgi:GR25 family glycosyltransferase involved in LPS biosynthesis